MNRRLNLNYGWAVFLGVLLATLDASAGSLSFDVNETADHEYAHQLTIPAGFGDGEFTFELWIRLDDSFPVGPTTDGTPGQLTNWSDADEAPYSSCCWWFSGNFLLDGHNNGAFEDGTFSLQFYGGGRLRWLFGDGAFAGPGGHWSVGAFPATDTPSLLDSAWHQVTLVRRFTGVSDATLELWIDGALVDTEVSNVRTDMRTWWDVWSGFPSGQEGWFWGAEKQAAIGVLSQYEDYKGLVDEVRFWDRAKSAAEIAGGFGDAVTGGEPGLLAVFRFDEETGTTTCDDLDAASCWSIINADASVWSTEEAPVGPMAVPAISFWMSLGLGLMLLTMGTVVWRRSEWSVVQ